MLREAAIEILAARDAENLSATRRKSLLEDWWSIDAHDAGFDQFPLALKEELETSEGPTDPERALYLPLLVVACRSAYVGVTNQYIQERLRELGRGETNVEGPVERLVCCKCCEYRSLSEGRGFDVCKVCFWEDDGTTELDQVSGANHLSLREARKTFATIGAVSEPFTKFVLSDGTRRYERCRTKTEA